ncbi:MAG TPA: ADOP family duplicated permease, partial [Vicinamibacterales bacterium]
FSWIQSRLLTPMPAVEDGARFHGIESKNEEGRYPSSSWLEYEDMRDGLRSFDAVIAFGMAPLYIGDPGQVQRAFGVLASGNYFDALGLRPAAGRLFTAGEAAARAPAAVISHGVWQSRFGGRGDISGQRLRVNGVDVTIIGVTPRDFHGTVLGLSLDIWVPATIAPMLVRGTRELEDRGIRNYSVLGRLRDGVSRDQAQAEAAALMSRLASAYPDTNAGLTAEVVPFWNSPRGPNRLLNAALLVLQAVMLLLLLAVCGNTANLVLARASARQKEIGVRLALGSGPWRIARLLIIENTVLGVLGALGGAAIAVWGTEALKVIPLSGLPIRLETSVDLTGLAFALVLGVVSGVIVGAVPAAQLARMDPAAAFRGGARSAGRSRLRHALMASQVALAMVVLVAGALFLRGFLATRTEETGFRRDGVLLAAYDLAGRDASRDDARRFADRLLERVRALPSVEHAAIASAVPLDIHGFSLRPFTLEGRPRVAAGQDAAFVNTVTPGYFETMDIRLEEGSDFVPLADAFAPPQVVVNRAFVRAFIGQGSAIGRRLEARGQSYVITGVAADSLYNAFGEPPSPMLYFSYRDRPAAAGEIHVRAAPGGDALLAARLQAIVRELDADLPVFNIRTLEQHIDTNLVFRRIPARMFAFLGPLLLVLAAIGIYAVVAYGMSLRTPEIGLRLALGASPRRVVVDLVTETMTVIVAGAAAGWLAAWSIAAGAMGDGPVDLQVFAGVPALLLAVAAAACWLPARRAARLDPWQALR